MIPAPSYPPENPIFLPPLFNPPPMIIPPVIIPPGEPPCDKDKDPDCDETEEPPVDVPEPGVLILLITGALIFWAFGRKRAAPQR